MAQIPQYTARKGLDPDRIPDTTIVPYEARAMEKVGSAIQDVGAMLVERQQQKENFVTENQYRKFQLDLTNEMSQRQQNMPEGGIGFHEGFMNDVFKPKRDAFLEKVPPRLRDRFSTMLSDAEGAATTEWSNKAAAAERDETYRWAKDEISVTQSDLANAISMNPEQYDELLSSGRAVIEQAPIPTLEKRQLLRDWENMAQVSHLQRLMQDDPELVLKALGANPNLLSPTSQFEVLRAAVETQETRGNPYQVSEAGAIGAMQILPGTASDIAKEIGDANFPRTGNPDHIKSYLMQPDVNRQYGSYLLKKLMKKYPNDLEAVLIAYHSGPGNADKWIKAGRDDSVLGPVGRKYYKEVIARLPGGSDPAGKTPSGGAIVAGSVGSVKMVWTRGGENRAIGAGDPEFDALSPQLIERTKAAFAAVGLTEIKVNSGYRDKAHNAKVGGASKSEHINGNALDLNVTGMSREDRLRLIASLSAAGITGIGVGNNIIHADIGSRRAWGYDASGKVSSVPDWARGAINAHLTGKSQVPLDGVRTVGRYATLPYDKRQQFINNADTALTQRITAAQRGSVVDRVSLQNQMDDELARIRATGAASDTFDETQIASVLGEDNYLKWVEKRQEAQKTFTAVQGLYEMSPPELAERISDYEPNPASPDFASQQKIYATVVKEADRVSRLRASSPDKAALEYPDVKKAYAGVQEAFATGELKPAEMQSFVKMMIQRQREFGVSPEAAAPIPSEWAFEIGQSLTRVPELAGRNLADVRAAVAVQYSALQEYFGEYTDEVIIYALSQYKGISKNNAELITAYMQRIGAGGDPFAPRVDVEDRDQVERSSGFFDGVRRFFGGEDPEEAAGKAPTPEVINRVLNRLGDVDDAAEEAVLVEQYGQAAVAAAKAQLERSR
jgi:hypothetical protein